MLKLLVNIENIQVYISNCPLQIKTPIEKAPKGKAAAARSKRIAKKGRKGKGKK